MLLGENGGDTKINCCGRVCGRGVNIRNKGLRGLLRYLPFDKAKIQMKEMYMPDWISVFCLSAALVGFLVWLAMSNKGEK